MDINPFMALGFIFAAYSVVANDVIQTLGTFLSSNRTRPWWVLFGYSAFILVVVLVYGWIAYDGDVSYGRLTKVGGLPDPFNWWYALPPLILLIITRFGIPVSTTFLILSVFASNEQIMDMVSKSVFGYLLAFVVAIVVYLLITQKVEKKYFNTAISDRDQTIWTVLQWCSTGFLWSQWLIQDLANIYVFLPRELPFSYLVTTLVLMVVLLGYVFYSQGGIIQRIVTSKINTADIRSATIIDFIYAFILLYFKELNEVPMSTTWVFVGLLAGRELMMNQMLKVHPTAHIFRSIAKDLGKVFIGLIVSVLLVVLIAQLEKV
jgi:hypothetical protein